MLSRRAAWERLSTIDVANAVAKPGAPGTTPPPSRSPAVFRPLPFSGDDTALLAALKVGHPGAVAAFYDRFCAHVQRILVRVLGADRELADVHHDVFVRALGSIKDVTEPAALKAWVTQVAVFTARTCIQRRSRRWWLRILPPDEVPEVEATVTTGELNEALRATYAVLDKLPADERIAFALRFIDGMELTEVARSCGCSLATIKRKLGGAEKRFVALARRQPVLLDWLEGGARWGSITTP